MPKITFTFSFSLYYPQKLCDIWLKLRLLYRWLIYGRTFRKIPITQGKYAMVDVEDYDYFSKYKWYFKCGVTDNTGYAARYQRQGGKIKNIVMHRQIMMFRLFPDLYLNPDESLNLNKLPSHLLVDHIDGNGLNNTKANLRLATPAQNSRNKNKRSNSKYKGVSKSRYTNKWYARICCNYKTIHIGTFDTKKDAALAYDRAALKYHKEFANLNFPKHKH